MTTVSVYNKTGRSAPINTGENVLETGSHFDRAVVMQILALLMHFLVGVLWEIASSCQRFTRQKNSRNTLGWSGDREQHTIAPPQGFLYMLLVCQLGRSVSGMLCLPGAVTWPWSKNVTGSVTQARLGCLAHEPTNVRWTDDKHISHLYHLNGDCKKFTSLNFTVMKKLIRTLPKYSVYIYI